MCQSVLHRNESFNVIYAACLLQSAQLVALHFVIIIYDKLKQTSYHCPHPPAHPQSSKPSTRGPSLSHLPSVRTPTHSLPRKPRSKSESLLLARCPAKIIRLQPRPPYSASARPRCVADA